MKAHIKRKEAEAILNLLTGHLSAGLTQKEFWLRFVEGLIDEACQQVSTIMCMNFINHVQGFLSDALELKDLLVGQRYVFFH